MKIKLLNLSFLLLLFLICYLVVKRSYTKHQLNKFNHKGNKNFHTKESIFKNFISKINFLKTKDLFLFKQGYPLKLDAIRYYSLKVMMALLFLSAGLKNYNSKLIPIVLSLIGYFFIDLYIFVNKKSRNAEICNDLYSVVNSVCLQLSSHMTLKDSLKYQYKNCKNKDFKKAMIEFSTCYELSGLNIDTAVKTLNDKFDILEVQMFCNAMSEYNQTGNIIDILDNLSVTLGEKQIDRLKDNTRQKILYITLGVIIALGNIIMLVFFPLFISLEQGFNNIFK